MTRRTEDHVEHRDRGATGQHGAVTRRELEVLELVADGLTNGEIADQLVVSARTVQAHVSNLVEKTGTRNRTQLAVTAVRMGIIE